MTARDKARLRRIIESNATAYREERRNITLRVINGSADEPTVSNARRALAFHAQAIAEAVATLTDHTDPEDR